MKSTKKATKFGCGRKSEIKKSRGVAKEKKEKGSPEKSVGKQKGDGGDRIH